METEVAMQPVAVPRWAWMVVAVSAAFVGLVTLDAAVLLGDLAEPVHELFHDARHFIGAPCH